MVEESGLHTCEQVSGPPPRFEGQLEVYGNEVQLAFFVPQLHVATGERTLMGRFFHGRDEERQFIADASFHTLLRVGDLDCLAFARLGLDAFTEGERAFTGRMRATYEMTIWAPPSCPRACLWEVDFRARRIGDTMNDLSRSLP